MPFIQTTFDFKVKGGKRTLPALVMTNDEASIIYDGVMIKNFEKLYAEDGIFSPPTKDLYTRFARGLTILLDPKFQNFKYQILENRMYYKPIHDFDDAAIVIQGPIAYENNYTVETFKFYRSIYPNVPIVVSTWTGVATNSFRRECKENSVVLLENEPPKSPGIYNVDMQLKSSLEGVRYIKENTSAKFVLKTRTDQRINYFSFLVYFKNLLKTFPPKGDKLHKRIIFLGSALTKNFPFHPHDFLSFGHVEDIFKLYDIPAESGYEKVNYFMSHRKTIDRVASWINGNPCRFDYNTVTEQSSRLRKFNKVMSRVRLPEIHLTRTFYEKYIAPVDDTKIYETSWKFAVDYLILVDFDTLQLDWPKYEDKRYKPEFLSDFHGNAFARWLDMYRNFKIDWV